MLKLPDIPNLLGNIYDSMNNLTVTSMPPLCLKLGESAECEVGFNACLADKCGNYTVVVAISYNYAGVDSYIQLIMKFLGRNVMAQKLSISTLSNGHMKVGKSPTSGEMIAADSKMKICATLPLILVNPAACFKLSNIILVSNEGLMLDASFYLEYLLFEHVLLEKAINIPKNISQLDLSSTHSGSCIDYKDAKSCTQLSHCGWCTHNGGRCLPAAVDSSEGGTDVLGICTKCGWFRGPFTPTLDDDSLADACLNRAGCGKCSSDCVEGTSLDMAGWKACKKGWEYGARKHKAKKIINKEEL